MIKIFVLLSLCFAFFSCSSTKDYEEESQKVNLPLSGSKYKTDNENFRAVQLGRSPDLSTSKKIAILNAKTELASMINTLIKNVKDNYTNQRTVQNVQDFENKFEELQKEVVSQHLNNVKIIGEETYKEKDGSYTYWIAIEVSKADILNVITSNKRFQLDLDKQLFEKSFNAEMERLANEGN